MRWEQEVYSAVVEACRRDKIAPKSSKICSLSSFLFFSIVLYFWFFCFVFLSWKRRMERHLPSFLEQDYFLVLLTFYVIRHTVRPFSLALFCSADLNIEMPIKFMHFILMRILLSKYKIYIIFCTKQSGSMKIVTGNNWSWK